MPEELIVQNATYKPDQKHLELVIALADYNVIDTTVTMVDKSSGQQISQVITSEKKVNMAFGDTIYCPDAQGHTHVAASCAKAHADYGKLKTSLSGKLSDWRTKSPAVNMTPADRKLE